MRVLDRFNIDIYKLSNATHQYDFEFDDTLFGEFEDSFVDKGKGKVKVTLEKNESFIKLTMTIDGSIELQCDRSLDLFDFPLHIETSIIFKYGEEEQELDDEIVIITRDRQRLNLAQYIYEFIGLEVPMKKLHPRFEDETGDDELIYSSEKDNDEGENKSTDIDPRWEKLKKLK
jgi:uncharacterized protein